MSEQHPARIKSADPDPAFRWVAVRDGYVLRRAATRNALVEDVKAAFGLATLNDPNLQLIDTGLKRIKLPPNKLPADTPVAEFTPLLEISRKAEEAGAAATRTEMRRDKAVERAARALNKFLADLATPSGLRGFRTSTGGAARTITLDSSAAPELAPAVDVSTGALLRVKDAAALAMLWSKLPQIIATHCEASLAAAAAASQTCDTADAIYYSVRALTILIAEQADVASANTMLKQLFENPQLLDALRAAESTKDPKAVANVILTQAGVIGCRRAGSAASPDDKDK